jgi:hypothetical protein
MVMCWERERIIQIQDTSHKLSFICGLNVGNRMKKENKIASDF